METSLRKGCSAPSSGGRISAFSAAAAGAFTRPGARPASPCPLSPMASGLTSSREPSPLRGACMNGRASPVARSRSPSPVPAAFQVRPSSRSPSPVPASFQLEDRSGSPFFAPRPTSLASLPAARLRPPSPSPMPVGGGMTRSISCESIEGMATGRRRYTLPLPHAPHGPGSRRTSFDETAMEADAAAATAMHAAAAPAVAVVDADVETPRYDLAVQVLAGALTVLPYVQVTMALLKNFSSTLEFAQALDPALVHLVTGSLASLASHLPHVPHADVASHFLNVPDLRHLGGAQHRLPHAVERALHHIQTFVDNVDVGEPEERPSRDLRGSAAAASTRTGVSMGDGHEA